MGAIKEYIHTGWNNKSTYTYTKLQKRDDPGTLRNA